METILLAIRGSSYSNRQFDLCREFMIAHSASEEVGMRQLLLWPSGDHTMVSLCRMPQACNM